MPCFGSGYHHSPHGTGIFDGIKNRVVRVFVKCAMCALLWISNLENIK